MTPAQEQPAERGGEVTFSDLVFAVVLVLIPLRILLPENYVTNEVLHDSIGDASGQLFGCAVAFGLIGVLWADHHRYLAGADSGDTILFWGNLAFLGCVVLLTFPTAVFTKHLGAPVAVLVFSGAMVICAGVWATLWWWGRTRAGGATTELGEVERRRIQVQALAMPAVLVITAPLALADVQIRADEISVAVFAWIIGVPLARLLVARRFARV